jgi:hypothetical protein
LAAYTLTVNDQSGQSRRVADSIWKVLIPTMEDGNVKMIKRKSDGTTIRNILINRREFISFVRLIKV